MTASEEALQNLQNFEKEHPDIVRLSRLLAEHDELLHKWISAMVRPSLQEKQEVVVNG